MGKTERESTDAKDESHEGGDGQVARKSSSFGRLGVLLVVFIIAAGGIWGYRQYLKSTLPKADTDIAKQKISDTDEPEPVPTGLSILAGMFSAAKPSKEIEELKGKSSEEVAFTYDAIIDMTPEELEKNIRDISGQLETLRKNLPPSLGGATAGGPPEESNGPPQENATETPATIPSLALPLEVMKQIAESKK